MNEELHVILCAKCKQPNTACITEDGEVMVTCPFCGIATPADYIEFCHRAGIRINSVKPEQN